MDLMPFVTALGEYTVRPAKATHLVEVTGDVPWRLIDKNGLDKGRLVGHGVDELTALLDLFVKARDGCERPDKAFAVGEGEDITYFFIDEMGFLSQAWLIAGGFTTEEPREPPLFKYPPSLVKVAPNINEPPMRVRHAELKRADKDSAYKSICPVCNTGWLLVERDIKTFQLNPIDRCTRCGQHVIYSDIHEIEV
jgi:hypothetical protein